MNSFGNDWWRQPRREWEEEHWGDPVIPGRPSEERQLPEIAKPATDQDFKEYAERIKRRLGEEPSSGNAGGRGGATGDDSDFEETSGIDACAYYLSFRYRNRYRWGIYIGLECWFSYAKYLFDRGISAEAAVDEAFYLLYRHEYFHFEVDKAIEIMERGVGISTGTKPKAWLDYHQSNSLSLLEEALANAHAYEHAGKRHKKVLSRVKGLVKAIFSFHGPGYRDFADVAGSKVKGDARSQLISEIMGIHKKDNRFVPGLQSLIRPPSFVKSKEPIPRVNYEGERLNVYFF